MMRTEQIDDRRPPVSEAPRHSVEIRVEGVLDRDWTTWFDGLAVTADGSQSVLSGSVEDQAALYGVLLKSAISGSSSSR